MNSTELTGVVEELTTQINNLEQRVHSLETAKASRKKSNEQPGTVITPVVASQD